LPAVVIAADINAFHVAGAILALWALIVAFLGTTRADFPGSNAGEKAVMAISGILVLAAIGTGIGTSAAEGGEKGGESAPEAAPPSGPAQELKLAANADNQLAFDKTALKAKAGNVRITMENPAQIDHNVSLEGPGGIDEHGDTVGNGDSSEVEAELQPGTYTFYCSVPGHREGGMEGKLTVTK
jgi:uncharacterized cupredoxin-like copper-binding protein